MNESGELRTVFRPFKVLNINIQFQFKFLIYYHKGTYMDGATNVYTVSNMHDI